MPLNIFVDPTGTTTTENGICVDALQTNATEVFVRLLKHIEPRPRYQDLGFAHVDPKSLSFHVGLPEDQLLCNSCSMPTPPFTSFLAVQKTKLVTGVLAGEQHIHHRVSCAPQRSIFLLVKVFQPPPFPPSWRCPHSDNQIWVFSSARIIFRDGRILQPALEKLPNPIHYWLAEVTLEHVPRLRQPAPPETVFHVITIIRS